MASFLDQLRGSRTAPQSLWVAFVTGYGGDDTTLHVFSEGKDDLAIYPCWLREWWGASVVAYPCGGKKGVVYNHSKLRNAAIYKRTMFVVDRDLDDYLGTQPGFDERLYITRWYSCESEFTTEDVLGMIWQDIFRLSPTDPRRSVFLNGYRKGRRRFTQIMRPVMALAIWLKKQGAGVPLADLRLEDFIELRGDGSPRRRAGACIGKQLLGNSGLSPTLRDVRKVVATLASDDRIWLRGKFDLWYMIRFVNFSLQALSAKGQPERVVMRMSLSHSNAVEVIAPRISRPVEWKTFLDGFPERPLLQL